MRFAASVVPPSHTPPRSIARPARRYYAAQALVQWWLTTIATLALVGRRMMQQYTLGDLPHEEITEIVVAHQSSRTVFAKTKSMSMRSISADGPGGAGAGADAGAGGHGAVGLGGGNGATGLALQASLSGRASSARISSTAGSKTT